MINLRNRAYGLLRFSERIFKTDMVYLAKGGFWLVSSQIFATLASFLLSIAFANFLLPEAFGTYKYLLSLSAILTAFSLGGLSSAVTLSAARGKDGTLMRAFFMSLKWSIILFILAAIGSTYYFLNGNTTLAIGALIIGVFSPLLDAGELYSGFLNGKKNFRQVAIYKVGRSLITLSGLFAVIIFTNNPLVILGAYFILHTSTVSVLFWLTAKNNMENKEIDPESLRLGKHASFMNGLAAFADATDGVLVFHYLGPLGLAIYNFAVAIPNHISGLIKNLVTLAIPKFVTQDKDHIKKKMPGKGLIIFLSTIPILAAYIALAPLVFQYLFPQYMDSVLFSQVYAFIILINGVLPSALLNSQIAIRAKYLVNLTVNPLRIVILIFAASTYGLWGVIIARLINKLLAVSVGTFVAYRL